MNSFDRAVSLEDSICEAAAILARARHIACLTGAGISAESGVSTFRDALTGLWSTFDPQRLASQEGFAEDPGFVWRWYMGRLAQVEQAQPNAGHRALAELERRTRTFTLVTQNVDNLHERAGSQDTLHLHGRINTFHCNECGAAYALSDEDRIAGLPPYCIHCGGWVRPSVVWFGEMLPEYALDEATRAAQQCDVMLVVGTSGIVYPAASLPEVALANGATVIDVNPEPNPISEVANYYLCGTGGVILPALMNAIVRVDRG